MSFRNSIKLFSLHSFFYSFDLYNSLRIIFFYKVTNSYSAAATLISLIMIFSALMEVPTGIFSDLIGRKRTIILGSLCLTIAYLLYALRLNYFVLIVGALLEGSASAWFSGNNDAYLHNILSDENKQDRYDHYFGRVKSLVMTALMIGTLIGGVLINFSVELFMWLNIIPQFLGFCVAILMKDIKREEKVDTNIYQHLLDAFSEIKNNLTLRYMSLSEVLGGGGLAAGELQTAVFAVVWPTWAVGIARGVQIVGTIPGYFYAGKIIKKLGKVKVIALSTTVSILGNVFTSIVRTVISPIFVMLSLPLYGADSAANQSLLQREFSERQRATIASLNSLGNTLTAALVIYISGLIANKYGPFVALLSTQFFLIPALFYQYLYLKRVHSDSRDSLAQMSADSPVSRKL